MSSPSSGLRRDSYTSVEVLRELGAAAEKELGNANAAAPVRCAHQPAADNADGEILPAKLSGRSTLPLTPLDGARSLGECRPGPAVR